MLAGLQLEDRKRALLIEIATASFIENIYGKGFQSYPYMMGGGDYIKELKKLNPSTLLPIVEGLIEDYNNE